MDEGVFYSQFSPYIGIAPDSTMDGYPVMDIATFLGANSGYYLSRFHFMRLQKSLRYCGIYRSDYFQKRCFPPG